MFNVGGGEFVVIAVLALIVLGPQRLPDAARQIGKVMADLRRMSAGFQQELESALDDVDPAAKAAVKRHVLGRVPGSSSPLARGLSTAVAAVSSQGGSAASEPDQPSGDAPAPKKGASPSTPAKRAATKKAPPVKKQASAKKAVAKKPLGKKAGAPARKAVAKKPAATKKAPAKKKAPSR